MDGALLTIKVHYERRPEYGRSLEWIAPELKDAALTLVEDRIDDARPSRKWRGIVDRPTFEVFANAWRLHDATGELDAYTSDGAKAQPARSYVLDGLNWETNGESPIVSVTLQIRGVTDAFADSGREPAEF
jgi:hypothetical protein